MSFCEMIEKTISDLEKKFQKDPFQFYSEKDIHSRFFDLWIENRERWDEIKREYPADGGKNIDFVIKKDNKKYGIEFFLGTDTDKGWFPEKSSEKKCLWICTKNFSSGDGKEDDDRSDTGKDHFNRDFERLTNPKNDIDKGYIICLFRHWWKKGKRKSEKNKRQAYNNQLKDFKDHTESKEKQSERITVRITKADPPN